MVWNYHDVDTPGPDVSVTLSIAGVPVSAARVLVTHYRIDKERSNAYTTWQRMGSPQQPTDAQYRELEAAGQLQTLASPQWVDNGPGGVTLSFSLPHQGVSLVRLEW